MKQNIRHFLFRIIIPGLIAWFIMSACFLWLNRNKPLDPEKIRKHRPKTAQTVHPSSSILHEQLSALLA